MAHLLGHVDRVVSDRITQAGIEPAERVRGEVPDRFEPDLHQAPIGPLDNRLEPALKVADRLTSPELTGARDDPEQALANLIEILVTKRVISDSTTPS